MIAESELLKNIIRELIDITKDDENYPPEFREEIRQDLILLREEIDREILKYS